MPREVKYSNRRNSSVRFQRGGIRNTLGDGLAGWAQFRRQARQVDPACKSLTLATTQMLTAAPLVSFPPRLLISVIQMPLVQTDDSKKARADGDDRYARPA